MLGCNGETKVRARALVGASVAFLLAACGGKAHESPSVVVHGDTSELFGSGTRLKAHYLDGGGGARELLNFRDSALGIDCAFVETSSAEWHCLPVASTITFSDSACTEPVVITRSLCAADPAPVAGMMVMAGSAACDSRASAYSLVEQEDVSGTFLQNPGDYCLAPLAAPSAPSVVWSLASEPLTRFVAGAASFVGAAGGAQARRVTGDDGSFVNLDVVANGASCSPVASGDVLGCVPGPITSRSQSIAVYADATCTDSTVAQALLDENQRCSGEQPQYVLGYTSKNCKVDTAVYRAGAALNNVFEQSGTCEPLATADPQASTVSSFVQIGALVQLDTFPRVTEGGVGSGALTVDCWGDSTGAPLSEPEGLAGLSNWNVRNGSPCQVLPDANGQERCVHDAVQMNYPFYSDTSCTNPVYSQSDADCLAPAQYLIDGDFGICKTDFTQAYLATPYSGPVYSMQSGSCQSYTDTVSYYRFFTAGAAVPAETFPAIAETIDP